MVWRAVLLSVLFGGAAAVGTFLWLGEDLATLRRVSLATLAAGVAWTLLNYAAGGARLWLLNRRAGHRVGYWRSARAHALGLFSAAVTPGGSGQAPAIVLAMIGEGVPHARAWALVVRIWALDLAFLAWAVPTAALVLGGSGLPFEVSPLLAVAVGALFLGAGFVLTRRLGLLRRIIFGATGLGPLRRFRRPGLRFATRLEEANRLASGQPLLLRLLLHLCTTALYAGTYMTFVVVARGLGSDASIPVTIAAVLLPTIVSFLVPTPGGSGFIEVAAAALASERLQGAGIATAVIIWRLLVHYSRFVVGAVLGGPMVMKAAESLRRRREGEPSGGDPGDPVSAPKREGGA